MNEEMREALEKYHEARMESESQYGPIEEHYYHWHDYTVFVDKWGFIDCVIPTHDLGF